MKCKYSKVVFFLRQCNAMKRRFLIPFRLMRTRLWNSESYYPEMAQKSKCRIFLELLGHSLKYADINWHYFEYGFDIKNFRKQDEYLDESYFLWVANFVDTILPFIDYTCILRDKMIFANLLTNWGFSTPHTICEVNNPTNGINMLLSKEGGYFCKPIDGMCGKGIFSFIHREGKYFFNSSNLEKNELDKTLNTLFSSERYIIQTLIEQHDTLNAIYDKSVNTLRLLTIYDKGNDEIFPLSAVLRVGTNGNTIDNWAQGGLAIGVDLETGCLKKYGIYKKGFGTKTSYHPTSNVKFEGITLPYFQEAMNDAKRLHYKLKNIPIIGWDIALTQNGPMFIEGNDNPEIAIMQAVNGGLKRTLNHILGKYKI